MNNQMSIRAITLLSIATFLSILLMIFGWILTISIATKAITGQIILSPVETESTEEPVVTSTPLPPIKLILYPTQSTLTIYIDSSRSTSLRGLQLRVKDSAQVVRTLNIESIFTILQSSWIDKVDTGTCFIIDVIDDELDTSIRECQDSVAVFRYSVNLADAFWYDPVLNQPRDIQVFRSQKLIGICQYDEESCVIEN